MNASRLGAFALASSALFGPAWAEVRSLAPAQTLPRPSTQTFASFAQGVAIDGGYIIVLAAYQGGQSALLYRRNVSDGQWTYRRTLLTVSPPVPVRGNVRMKNGIAVIQFGDDETIFELSGGDYVRGTSAVPIQHPGGVAISGNSILIGGNDCDYDAVIYQKGTDGNWGITGRIDDHQGECRPEGLAVELNYDYALLRVPINQQVTAWRRNGTALDWVPAGSLVVPPPELLSSSPYALQNSTAVATGSAVLRRSGTTWAPTGKLVPVNHGNGAGEAKDVVYRDGAVVTSELSGQYIRPSIYLENSPGQFEHVAILETTDYTRHHDISGTTVVVAFEDYYNIRSGVEVFNLPAPLRVPRQIVNDFELRDISGFTFNSGLFALATRGTDDVLAQTNPNGLSVALLTDSEWSDFQHIEAEIALPSSTGWAGVIARYVDPNNYYYVAVRKDGGYSLHSLADGVDLTLYQAPLVGPGPWRVALTVDGNDISVSINDQYPTTFGYGAPQLGRGRAGLITSQNTADFDDVRASATGPVVLLDNDYHAYGAVYGRPFTQIGGDWHVIRDYYGYKDGFTQTDKSGDAVAFIGTPVENQEIVARMQLDSFGTGPQHAWFGLLARYVDAANHYYVTVRSSNQIEIRKVVNGVVTVLAAANFTATPREDHDYRFRVTNDHLQLLVDNVLVASANDGDIARGQYGLATYRTAATWKSLVVLQP
jgi:hypothetical protein